MNTAGHTGVNDRKPKMRGRKIEEIKRLQHTRATPKRRAQTPYVYLSREAIESLGWNVDMPVTVTYDLKTSLITIQESESGKSIVLESIQEGGRNG